jgi:hypothetical protein
MDFKKLALSLLLSSGARLFDQETQSSGEDACQAILNWLGAAVPMLAMKHLA